MSVVVRLLLSALRARGRVSLATFGIAVLAAATAATGPLWVRAAEESVLRESLTAADPGDTRFVAAGGIQPQVTADQLLEQVESAAKVRELDRWFGPASVAAWLPSTTVSRGDLSLAEVRVGWFEEACTTVVIVRGRCPQAVGEVLVGEDAERLGAGIGDVVALQKFELPPGTTARVVGVYRPAGADSPVWGGQDVFDAAAPGAGLLARVDTFFVTRETAIATPDIELRAHASRPLLAERVRLDDLPALLAAVRAQTDPARATLAQVSSGLPGELRTAATQRRTARITAAAVVLQLALLAIVVLHLVCVAGAEAREPELAVAKLRGVRPVRAFLLVLAEPAVLLVAAAVTGLLLAWPLTGLVVRLTLDPGAPVVLTGGAIAAAAAVVGAGLVVAAVSSWRSVTAPLAGQLRRATGSRTARRRAVAIDVAACVAAAAALYETSRDTPDLLTLTGPGLLAVAAGLLLSRLLRPAAGVVRRATRWTTRTVPYLASRQLARRPATHRLVVLAAVAVALATFAVDCSLVAARHRTEQAQAQVGADRVLHLARTTPAELLAAVRTADPAGRAAMAVLESDGSSPSGATLAVDSTRLAAVAPESLRFLGTAAADVPEKLRPAQHAPYVVRDGVTLDLTARQVTLDLYPVVVVRAPDGVERVLPLGLLREGRHTYTARDPACDAGCRVVRFEVGVGDPAATSVATLVVHRFTDLRGTAVPAADLARWRGVPSDDTVYDAPALMTPTAVPDGVALNVSARLAQVAAIEPDDHPQYLPGIVGAGVRRTNAVPGKGLPAARLDGGLTLLRPVGDAEVVPRVGRDAALVDLEYADRASVGRPDGSARYQVWLSPAAGPGVERALTAAGLRIDDVETTAARRAELDDSGVAVGLRLYLVVSAAGLALVVAALVATLLAGAARRGWEVAVLRMLGTRPRTITAATAIEHGVLLLAGAGAGLATGLVTARLSLPALLAAAPAPIEVPPATAPAWGATAAFAAGTVVVIAVVSVLVARAATGAADATRLREAQP